VSSTLTALLGSFLVSVLKVAAFYDVVATTILQTKSQLLAVDLRGVYPVLE